MRKIITIEDFSLDDITPYNIKNSREFSRVIPALDFQLGQITREINQEAIIYAIDNLSAEILDYLAVQFHVDFYDLAYTLEMKRSAIKNSVLWHMKKGTSWAILTALKSIGIDGEFLHWHDTGDEPYSFRIRANITGDFYRTQGKDAIIKSIVRVVNESKAARSYFAGLETNIKFQEDIGLYVANFPLLSGHKIIRPSFDREIPSGKIYAGLVKNLQGERKIFPARIIGLNSTIYAGLVQVKNITHEAGVNLDIMQELLLKFEDRIFKRFDDYEARIDKKISEQNERISEQNKNIQDNLEKILDLLRWKGYDDD